MLKMLIVLFLLGLSACTLHAEFSPQSNKLHNATVGIPYNEKINIIGGAVTSLDSAGRKRFVGDITPVDSGLYLQYCNNSPANNCVQIKGVPVKPGLVKIRVHGGLYGTNFSVGSEFDKTYTIIIKKPDGTS
ncbi:hypothetical protein GW590_15505 [Rahnella sp. SAP-1]|uniref:Lipoprotein n=1 Tax=Rouxiella aceris TaxID=2703884 RepID=A0A848MIK1_9GAMM|nr:hypothetical protein [Rouxiella aceris]NMP28268.1 hypothetical protein [Rouxiella aceris]